MLVGDSLTDIYGAKAAGVRVIGYANRASKAGRFRAAGAGVVVSSMREIADVLVERLSF